MFDHIEKLKQDYTDKYVVVAPGVPELARFGGHVGQVKTVNMNGRALVEFDAWNNIGWYDIDLGFLRVVPKPEAAAEAKAHDTKQTAPRPATKATATMEPGEKKLSALEMARQQGAAKPAGAKSPAGAAAAGAKQSTADILAAARANKTAPAAVAAKPATVAPAAKPSTADILAAARANKAAAATAAPPAAEASAAATEAPKPAPAAAAPAKPKAAAAEPALAPGQRLSVPQILDWCRQHDAK